jgi:hypothetical protein
MSTTTTHSNKNQFVPSALSAAVALLVAIPLSTALTAGKTTTASAATNTCPVVAASAPAGVSSVTDTVWTPGTTTSSTTPSTTVNNGSGSTAVVNGDGNVTAVNTTNLLNDSLNNNHILSDNTVNVGGDVLSDLLSGTTAALPAVTDVVTL